MVLSRTGSAGAPSAGSPSEDRIKREGSGWAVAFCCVPMLAGAVILVLSHQAGVAFLILFAASTAIMVLLMVGTVQATRRHLRERAQVNLLKGGPQPGGRARLDALQGLPTVRPR